MPKEIEAKPEETIEEQQKPSCLTQIKIHKFKIVVGILGAFIFVGAVFGAYKLGQKQVQPGSQPTPTSMVVATPTPDPTADWKTYTNTKYGYSIKYPEDWVMLEAATAIFHPRGETEIEPFYMFEIDVRENPTGLTPRAWFEKEYSRLWEENISVSFKEVEVSGLKREEVAFILADMPIRYVLIGRGNRIYLMNLIETSEIGSKEHQDMFNLMLSTFRFLE